MLNLYEHQNEQNMEQNFQKITEHMQRKLLIKFTLSAFTNMSAIT